MIDIDPKFIILLKTLRNRLEENPLAGMGHLDLAMPDGSDAQSVKDVAAVTGMDVGTAALAVLQAENAPQTLVEEAKDIYAGLGSHSVPVGLGTRLSRPQLVQRGRRYYTEDERERRRRMRRRKKKREKKAMRAPDTAEWNDSICIMLSIDGITPWPGGMKDSDLHITVAWYGKVDEHKDAGTPEEWIDKAKNIASKYDEFTVQCNGITRFSTEEEGGLGDPIVVNVDSPKIESIRADILSEFGPHKSEHGYTPHVTLAYIDPQDEMPMQRYPAHKAVVTGIIVSHGSVTETIKFRKMGSKA